jgi:hypothetical protein
MSAATATRRASAPPGWRHYVNDYFFDRPDLEPNLERLALRLERLAREKPWCVTSNDELMRQLGCTKNTLAAILNRGESLGWFRRVLVPGSHGRATARLGIVLFVRPTDRPVATPQTFDQVVDLMRAETRRDPASTRTRTLPFPAPIRRESPTSVPKNWAPPVPKNWGASVPKNWAPSPCSKEGEVTRETTTTDEAGSSSSFFDPKPEPEGNGPLGAAVHTNPPAPQVPTVGESIHPIVTPSALPIPTVATDLPAELVTAAAEAIPGASREWLSGLLRDCGGYGLDLALLVVAWVKIQRPAKPARYARVATSNWLTKLRAGELTLADVRAEVQGRSGPRASPRPFDPSICLARMESMGWTLRPQGPDQVMWTELPDRGPPAWKRLPSDLREEVNAHRAELKAYVLKRAAERGKAVSRGA